VPFNKEKYDACLNAIKRKGITVYGPRVLVIRDDAVETTKGGLVIPDEAQTKPKVGTVIALGQGYMTAEEAAFLKGVKVGHHIAFNAYDGVEQLLDTRVGKLVVDVQHVGNLYMGWDTKELKEKGD
jgi:chaperonin GroES